MLGTLQVSEGVIKVLKSRPRALGKPKYSGGFRLAVWKWAEAVESLDKPCW